ncbi:MAG: ribonuclease HI [Pseudomonadota bacterium]
MVELYAYTDGACSGNPGPGGWGVVLLAIENGQEIKRRELKGGAAETTNNQMELTAAIEALNALERPSALTLVTDSIYVKDGITKWIHGWKAKGWTKKGGLKNKELWQALDAATARHDITWEWIKGHAGHVHNERADELAREGMAPFKPNAVD